MDTLGLAIVGKLLCYGESVSLSTEVAVSILTFAGPGDGNWILPPLPGITPVPATIAINRLVIHVLFCQILSDLNLASPLYRNNYFNF